MTSSSSHPIVLISPAMGIGSRYYRPLVEAFEARGWAARALPRRGFEKGEAPASRDNDWSYADEIEVVTAAVAGARAEAPGRPVILLGHSLGGQLAVGHQAGRVPADGIVTVGASLPYHRDYPYGGLPLALMGGVIVPVLTAVSGYLPKPAFGGPGARTLMREWGRMAVTGRTPFPSESVITAPALVVALEGDRLAPPSAVDRFARRMFAPESVTNWLYRHDDVPEGASNDHIYWVRSPAPVADQVLRWWSGTAGSPRAGESGARSAG